MLPLLMCTAPAIPAARLAATGPDVDRWIRLGVGGVWGVEGATVALFGGGASILVVVVLVDARGGTAGGARLVEEVVTKLVCPLPSPDMVRLPLLLLAHFGPAPTMRRLTVDGRAEESDGVASVRSSEDLAAQERGGRAGTPPRLLAEVVAGDCACHPLRRT